MTRPAGGLEGKAFLVTGGGTGIGAACASALVADGAAVTICGRRLEVLEAAAERISAMADCGGSVQVTVADVTDEDSVTEAVARALEPTGSLDGCVANAGGGGGVVVEQYRTMHLVCLVGKLKSVPSFMPQNVFLNCLNHITSVIDEQ